MAVQGYPHLINQKVHARSTYSSGNSPNNQPSCKPMITNLKAPHMQTHIKHGLSYLSNQEPTTNFNNLPK